MENIENLIEKEQTPAKSIPRADAAVILISAAIAALMYAICFGGTEKLPRLSFALFCPALLFVVSFTLYRLNLFKNRRAFIWAAPILFLSLSNAIFTGPFTYGNVMGAHVLFAVFVISAQSAQSPDLYCPEGVADVIRVIVGNWLLLPVIFKSFGSGTKTGKKNENLKKILTGLVIAVPVLFIITAALMSADMVFSTILERFIDSAFNFSFINIPFLLCLLFSFIYAAGYLLQSGRILTGKRAVFPRFRADVLVSSTFLVLVNLLFLFFSIIQAAYLFGGGFMTLPEGLVYSQYAREGFFQLLFVTFVNFSVIIAFMCLMDGVNESRPLRILLLALCFFTGVLITSSFYRMFLYIDVYGHTPLRLCVITFLVMEVFLIIVTVWRLVSKQKINSPEKWLVKRYIIIALASYLIVNVTGSDYIATRLNKNLFLSGKLEAMDMYSIGPDGLHIIKPLLESDEYISLNHNLIKKDGSQSYPSAIRQTYEDILEISSDGYEDCWQNWSYFAHKN